MDGCGTCIRWIGLDPEQKIGTDEDSFERRADPRIEVSVRTGGLIETEQHLNILVAGRPAVRTAGQSGQNPGGASALIRIVQRLAYEDALAARRILRHLCVVWSSDQHRGDV